MTPPIETRVVSFIVYREWTEAGWVAPADFPLVNFHQEGVDMGNNNSPLESLAAFAIVFAVGVISTVGFGKYIEKLKWDAQRARQQP